MEERGLHKKEIYRRDCRKKKEVAWTVWWLELGKKDGGQVFLKGVDTPMHTMINGERSMNQETPDDYGNIAAGQTVLESNFVERADLTKRKHKFKLVDKTTFFYKESVVYPFINFETMVNFYIL